jgi:hypothetical protein
MTCSYPNNKHQWCQLEALSHHRWHLFTQTSGSVTYNGYSTDEFVVQRTAAYVDQQDNHIAELTVSGSCFRLHEYDVHHKDQVAACGDPS